MQNLFGDTFTFLTTFTVVANLESNTSKLPTKTFIAKKLNTTIKKLELGATSIEDIIVAALKEYEKEINALVDLCQREHPNSLASRLETFFRGILALIFKQPQLTHILSGNNLYAIPQFLVATKEINTTTYFAFTRLINVLQREYNNHFARLFTDCLQGIYFNISQNIENDPFGSGLNDLESKTKNEISIINKIVVSKLQSIS